MSSAAAAKGSQLNSANAQRIATRHYMNFMKSPPPGCSMHMLDTLTYHCSNLIVEGRYKGLVVHWELTIPPGFPQSPPFGKVVDGYIFNGKHHHHVFDSHGICADFLGNFAFMSQSAQVGYGWTPATDFHGLMINMQAFFADPDGRVCSESELDELFRMDADFKCRSCPHTSADPCPPLGSFEVSASAASSTATEDVVAAEGGGNDTAAVAAQKAELEAILARARRELVCSVSKLNLVDTRSLMLGYPVDVTKDRFGRLHTELIPELISYEEYMHALQVAEQNGHYSTDYFGMDGGAFGGRGGMRSLPQIRSATGRKYTHWLLVYINESHFQSAKSQLFTTLSVFRNGPEGCAANDFKPSHVLDVLLPLMNHQVVALMKGTEHESEAAVIAYSNLLRLLMRLRSEFPEVQAEIDRRVATFRSNPSYRTKEHCKDLGEFLIVLALSSPRSGLVRAGAGSAPPPAASASTTAAPPPAPSAASEATNKDEDKSWTNVSAKEKQSAPPPPATPGTGCIFLDDVPLKRALLEEFFARQIRWIRDADPNCLDFDNLLPIKDRLHRLFLAAETSNKLLIFNVEMTRFFVVPGFASTLDKNWGLPPQKILDSFRERVKKIKQELVSYSVMLQVLNHSHVINSPDAMLKVLRDAKNHSLDQGYERFQQRDKENHKRSNNDYDRDSYYRSSGNGNNNYSSQRGYYGGGGGGGYGGRRY